VDGAPGPRDVWRHRRWRRLVLGYGLTHSGEYLLGVVVVVVLADRTGSTGWVAAATVSALVAVVLLGPAAGAWAQYADRRRLLVGIGLARAAGAAVLAVVEAAGGEPVVVVVLGTAVAAGGAPVRPATFAATPDVVPEGELATAIASQSLISELSYFVGPALGAGAVAAASPAWGLAVGAVLLVAAAASWTGIGPSSGRPALAAPVPSDTAAVADGAAVARAVRIVRATPGLAALVSAMAAAMLLVGFEQVVHVFVSQERLGLGTAGVGVIAASLGVGALAALPFVWRVDRSRDPGLALAASLGVMAGALALLGVIRQPAVACVVVAAEGAASMVFQNTTVTLLQRGCPGDSLPLVTGLHDSATAGAQLVGSLGAPLLVSAVDLSGALVVVGGIVAGAAALAAPGTSRLARTTRAERNRLAPLVRRLQRLGLFGDAPTVVLERIARASQALVVPAGTVVFREDDPPADLYVVLAGHLDVITAALGTINDLGPDDWFGEIGLVHGIPRTASVVAATDAELLAVPGDVFLAAVTGGLGAGPERVMRTRLGRTHPHLLGRGPA
jgi:Na+/melibiose symporter-like transporter